MSDERRRAQVWEGAWRTVLPGWPQPSRPPGIITAECEPCSAISTVSLLTPEPAAQATARWCGDCSMKLPSKSKTWTRLFSRSATMTLSPSGWPQMLCGRLRTQQQRFRQKNLKMVGLLRKLERQRT